MGNKWQTTSLKELGVRLIDCDHKTPKAVESGIPYIGIPQMDNGRINFDANPRLISEDDFKHWTRKANPMYGDIILSRRCNSGETVYVPRNSKFALGQNLVLLRPEGERVHPEYLRWAVHGKEWWNEVAKYLNPGAIFESLKCADIPKFKIPEPPISAQIKIAEHLSAISGKIELNQKINQTLEQMAQALFKSWFVDFDPVFDNLLASVDFNLENLETSLPEELKQKAQRRLVALNSLENVAQCKASLSALAHELQALSQTKEVTKDAPQATVSAAETPVKANLNGNPKILVQHANTHAHFPNEFEHNEQLGWIPKGWEGKFFKEVIDKYIDNRGKTPPLVNNGIPLIEVKHIPESSNFPSFKSEKQFSLETYNTWFRAHVEERDILISTVGTIGRTAYVKDTKFGIAQNILGLRFGKHVNPEYMFYYIKSHRFQYDMDARLITTVQASIKRKDLDTITILVPDGQIQNRFSEIINSILTQQFSKKLESEQLAKLRDTLLPKLISGELQIPDIATDEEVVD